ncbi:MAG: tetratricopeptide repeat protein [Longimicrobiales bacterium]|nr:tetratricopeptide repeat protein [Longimicrobiales bacterium]
MVPRIRPVLAELKRRKVYHVAAVYVGVGLGVLGAAELILDPLGLGAFRPLIVILVLLGFPIAVVLAWAYEVRPESPAPAPEALSPDPGPTARHPTAGRSIAVLPFERMSPDPAEDYFADGITEELTNALARQKGLRVAARTSAFAFKGERVSVREIGRRLNVSYVIEGSVRRTDQALRITAQLISTDDGYHVWSEQFDRSHGDVFRIQEEIAGCVVRRLLHEVPDGQGPSIASAELSAYDAYLRGRYALARFHLGTLPEAIRHFEAAIRRDDHFAPALAGLAEALTLQSIGFSERPARETMPSAEAAAIRALELDPQLPEAHLARALARMYRDWDYSGAKTGFDRALELNPNFAEAHLWEEFYWSYVEHDFEKAIAANRRAHRLSPLDRRVRVRFSTVHYLFGKLEEAEALFRQELADGPEDPVLYLGLGDTLVRMGRLDEAVPYVEEALRLGGRTHLNLGMLGGFYGLQGNRAAANAILKEMEERQTAGYAPGFWMAVAYQGVGRVEEAFASLSRAVEERDSNLLYLFFAPRALGLHDDPRFEEIMQRIGLGHLVRSEEGTDRGAS